MGTSSSVDVRLSLSLAIKNAFGSSRPSFHRFSFGQVRDMDYLVTEWLYKAATVARGAELLSVTESGAAHGASENL